MPSRHLARVRTFQAIYALKFKPKEKPEKLLKDDLEKHPAKNMDEKLAFQLAKKYQKNRKKIDKIIQIAAPNWPIDKINPIDLSVLRASVTELLYFEETPPKVIINEAVEIAKQFGSENSHRFVNGVLGTIYRQSPRYEENKKEKN